MLDLLIALFPELETQPPAAFPFSSDYVALTEALIRLMNANAPRGGCALPGAISDVIASLGAEYGLGAYFTRNLANTGNAALKIGADKPEPDVLIVAHMDRPSFRVKDSKTGEIYPVCALRLPESGYTCAAKAIGYDAASGGMVIASRGRFIGQGGKLRYEIDGAGVLHPLDTIVMDAEPTIEDGIIHGTGLDNCLGVMAGLGAAIALAHGVDRLKAANIQIMIVFSDEEEGIPEVFFGHGAARLAHAVHPSIGAIVCDAQTVGAGMTVEMGKGGSHGVISGMGKGALVPPNFTMLACDLIQDFGTFQLGKAQLNTGYLSRSDDMGMARWTRVLGMIGTPMRDPHTAHESASIDDLRCTIEWLTVFTLAVSGIEPEITQRYCL